MPHLSNRSPLRVALVPAIDREGRNIGVVIAKGTWQLMPDGTFSPLHEREPVRLVAQPSEQSAAVSALPSDLCDEKPGVDVLVVCPEARWRNALLGRRVGFAFQDLRVLKEVVDPWPLGPLSPAAEPRRRFAGTYGADWRQRRMPLLPVDFDPRFHQVAPEDQIARHALGGCEAFQVAGLYGPLEGRRLRLPGRAVLVTGNIRQQRFEQLARLDTLQFWADRPWLTLVWRLTLRPRQKIEEIGTVVVAQIRSETAQELYGAARA